MGLAKQERTRIMVGSSMDQVGACLFSLSAGWLDGQLMLENSLCFARPRSSMKFFARLFRRCRLQAPVRLLDKSTKTRRKSQARSRGAGCLLNFGFLSDLSMDMTIPQKPPIRRRQHRGGSNHNFSQVTKTGRRPAVLSLPPRRHLRGYMRRMFSFSIKR